MEAALSSSLPLLDTPLLGARSVAPCDPVKWQANEAEAHAEPFCYPSKPIDSKEEAADQPEAETAFPVLFADLQIDVMQSPTRTSLRNGPSRGPPPMFSTTFGSNDWAASLNAPTTPYDEFPPQAVAALAPVAISGSGAGSTNATDSFSTAACTWSEAGVMEMGAAVAASRPTASRSKKRVRMYTDATRARHREVQRQFIQRKKIKIEQNKQLLATLESQVRLLSAHSETLDLQRERFGMVKQSLNTGMTIDAHVMTTFLEDQVEMIAQSYTPFSEAELHHLKLETLETLDMQQQQQSPEWVDYSVSDIEWSLLLRSHPGVCDFALSNQLNGERDALLERAWTGFTASSVQPGWLAGPSTLAKRRVLQAGGDLNVVFTALYDHTVHQFISSLELIMRVHRDNDVLIVSRRLEHPRLVAMLDRADDWRRHLVWFQFAEAVDGKSMVRCQGCVPDDESRSFGFSQELFFRALRFQTSITDASPFAVVAQDVHNKQQDETKQEQEQEQERR